MAYCIPVLPTALARWFLVVHGDVKPFASAEAQFSVKAIFSLSGVFDVVVFLLARQNNLLFGQSLGTRRSFSLPAPVRIGGKFVCWTTRHALTRSLTACVTAWIALNVFDVVWIYYCITYVHLLHECSRLTSSVIDILSATDPVPRRKSNENRGGWKAFYLMS